MYTFPYLEPLCCSMSSSNYCFLTCIQISQEAGQVVWYSHLFQNFPQLIVIHSVKGSCGSTVLGQQAAKRKYPMSKVSNGSREEIPHVQGKGQQLHFAGADTTV